MKSSRRFPAGFFSATYRWACLGMVCIFFLIIVSTVLSNLLTSMWAWDPTSRSLSDAEIHAEFLDHALVNLPSDEVLEQQGIEVFSRDVYVLIRARMVDGKSLMELSEDISRKMAIVPQSPQKPNPVVPIWWQPSAQTIWFKVTEESQFDVFLGIDHASNSLYLQYWVP